MRKNIKPQKAVYAYKELVTNQSHNKIGRQTFFKALLTRRK